MWLFNLIVFLLIPTLSFAQVSITSMDAIYVIDDFSDGLKSHISPFKLSGGNATQAQNVRINRKYGSLEKRSKRIELGSCRSNPVKSLYRYYKSDDTKYTVLTSSTFMDYIDSEGNCTELATGLSDSKRWSFITYQDILIGMNGTDNAKKWDGSTSNTANTDGHRSASDLIADLGAPFAELNTGSNLDASSWYQYKVAYSDGTNYWYSDAKSNPIATGSTVRDITLTDIPLGDAGITTRYIFRTEGQASRAVVVAETNADYKLVASISDNSTKTYNDTTADGSLTTVFSTWISNNSAIEVTPPKARFALIHKDRVFIANDPSGVESGKSTIYWTAPFKYQYFDFNNDYELIRPDDGDEIQFIANLLGTLTIGKTRTISKIYTDTTNDTSWTVSAPFSFIGCVAPYSVANTTAGIIYLGRHGLYSFNGQASELVSDVVTDKIRDILATNQEEVVGVFNDNKYFMAYTSAQSTESENNRVLVLDLVRNAYVLDDMEVDSWFSFDSGDDFGTLYSGSSATDGIVYSLSQAFSRLVYRYKSQLQEGTRSDTRVGGTETSPTIVLGSGSTWNDYFGVNWEDDQDITWEQDVISGTWTSPVIQINATQLDKLFWNETLSSTGDVTFAIRLGATEGATTGASWSSEFTDPSGSDISGETANNFIQIRASLSSDVYTETPVLFVSDSYLLRMTYKKEGTNAETSILSLWTGGKDTFGTPDYDKRIKESQIFYQGTEGTLTVYFTNELGEEYSFNIDLSVDPTTSTTDNYFGDSINKIYVYFPSFENNPVGKFWTIDIEEDGTESWSIDRIMARTDVYSYTTYK